MLHLNMCSRSGTSFFRYVNVAIKILVKISYREQYESNTEIYRESNLLPHHPFSVPSQSGLPSSIL